MRVVYKFTLDNHRPTAVPTTFLSKIVLVGEQHNQICIWLEMDPTVKIEKRYFEFYGTGYKIPEDHQVQHVGSCICENKEVYHVYEMTKEIAEDL